MRMPSAVKVWCGALRLLKTGLTIMKPRRKKNVEARIRNGLSVSGARPQIVDSEILFTWEHGTFSKAKARADFVMIREVPGAVPMTVGKVYTTWNTKYPDDLEEGHWRLDIAPNLALVMNEAEAIEQLSRSETVFSLLLVQNTALDAKILANQVYVDDDMLQRAHRFLARRRMNSSQSEAALNSLKYRVCQVQGPARTGKTDTCISTLALNTSFMEQEGFAKVPVLATSATNDAVDSEESKWGRVT